MMLSIGFIILLTILKKQPIQCFSGFLHNRNDKLIVKHKILHDIQKKRKHEWKKSQCQWSGHQIRENKLEQSIITTFSAKISLESDAGKPSQLSTFNEDYSILKEQIQTLVETRYGTTIPNINTNKNQSTDQTSSSKSNSNNVDRLRQYLYRSKERHRPMDVENVIEVMDYLDKVFYNEKNQKYLVQKIIYTSPRILRRNVECQLKPAVAFLKSLYGYDIFIKAITRNPDLLIISGVGFQSDDDGAAVTNFFRTQLEMSSQSIDKVKRSTPTVFQLSVEKTIEPFVKYLSSILLSAASVTSKSITSKPYKSMDSKTRKTIARVISNNPSLLHLDIDNNIQPTITFLREVCHMDDQGLATLIKSCPGVLGLSVQNNLLPTAAFLKNDLGLYSINNNIKGRKKSKNITRKEEKIKDEEKENYEEMMEKAHTDLKRCLSRHPQILGLSLENLKQKKAYFDSIEALSLPFVGSKSSQSLITRIAISAPSTFSLNLNENIIPKVQCLAKMWGVPYPDTTDWESSKSTTTTVVKAPPNSALLSSSNHTLAKRLSEYPPVLTLSLEGNIQPTIKFYNRTGYIQLNHLGEVTTDTTINKKPNKKTNMPKDLSCMNYEMTELSVTNYYNKRAAHPAQIIRARHLATSLFNRLLPRWHYLTDEMNQDEPRNDDDDDDDGNKLSFPPPLHILASATDEKFTEHYGIDPNKYQKYKSEAIPRLKFSTQFVTWIKTGRPIDGT